MEGFDLGSQQTGQDTTGQDRTAESAEHTEQSTERGRKCILDMTYLHNLVSGGGGGG